MKARFKYRIYPTLGQKEGLARLRRLCPCCLE
ncbi:MAG: helix-turn-helix domain-containing protein [Trichodesmium sp. St15_bin1_1]|nr:helix-turn-helix domain-containing protein [Trichodesmium sp. St5_bin2_1]MDE5082082.1 helix-turn-helix domain-containing protein [Trichodesmium sp. St18_bin1]MDE5087702.1 helix-turn-helix domain-containing protein [Trichodesmium sp. St16_bin2-tuft]MDE5115486.1 helix-turn-helix domain-containing protein [Trichodesmium sp. St15_bin1_1]MDE5120662.1 helix-turn-helix domain-containing protein [Trichodesmium sp. St19_bin1]